MVINNKEINLKITPTALRKIEEKYEDCDVQFYKGDQPLYYFIMAVE